MEYLHPIFDCQCYDTDELNLLLQFDAQQLLVKNIDIMKSLFEWTGLPVVQSNLQMDGIMLCLMTYEYFNSELNTLAEPLNAYYYVTHITTDMTILMSGDDEDYDDDDDEFEDDFDDEDFEDFEDEDFDDEDFDEGDFEDEDFDDFDDDDDDMEDDM